MTRTHTHTFARKVIKHTIPAPACAVCISCAVGDEVEQRGERRRFQNAESLFFIFFLFKRPTRFFSSLRQCCTHFSKVPAAIKALEFWWSFCALFVILVVWCLAVIKPSREVLRESLFLNLALQIYQRCLILTACSMV